MEPKYMLGLAACFHMLKEYNNAIQTYAKQIRNQPGLLKKATQKSNELQISLDSAIRLDAMKMSGVK